MADIVGGGLTDLRESEVLELKERWNDRALEDLAAFSNHKGGRLLVGIDDSGKPVGFACDDRELQRISNQVADVLGLNPHVQRQVMAGQEVLEIKVEPAVLPVPCRGRYLVRVGSVNREMNGEEIARRVLERSGRTWDALLSPLGPAEIDRDEVERFVRLARPRLSAMQAGEAPERIMENLDLIRQGQLTNAGVLLFAKSPQRQFPLAQLRIARFVGEKITSERTIGGTLWAQLDGVMAFLRDHLEIEYRIEPSGMDLEALQRDEVWSYPVEALREALLNALMHRDYASLGDTQVRVMDTQVSIWNPGGLYGGLSLKDLRQESHPSRLRNPLIAHVLYLAGLVERWGTGTTRMLSACRVADLPEPQFAEDAGGFRVIFKPAPKTGTEALTERQQVIWQTIQDIGHVQLGDLYPLFPDVSEKTIQRELKKLVDMGLIRALGIKKGRYYELAR